ncbi:MAG: four helix bundle protein [Candidatus Buchananbacteria bacterium RIFCSPHIGHO2_01_FULL_39_14]|uniref:Four helix bundle protein n=2 Tax=Candidatus Buchananiibacteriota TaxID=1817903 RepID=A0A1G1YLW7_9BACT|nr:MAG: four helix bundle protein [Candidatus Buchananbacteria bacterium RIFCSPHIGHO2_01_FULL_39_14]OGY49357.1 MAG: four helix bundle protein [Candidatus Buchananbacteria bacterium RIFCSPHIGHO2_02_FULL_39_17]OGY53353.1 MAG: four helix bundle protein [Candidatus Buchananbacteria bacterium RIFCSPLOWO2_01_FULL_40_23b]
MVKIETFKDLKVWQKSHHLVLIVYRLTRSFFSDERYSLVSQIRRAVVSIASNIVEGFNRRSIKDSLNFYNISRSSLEEVKYQLLVVHDLDYISELDYQNVVSQCDKVGKMLNAWSNSQRINFNS